MDMRTAPAATIIRYRFLMQAFRKLYSFGVPQS